MAKKLATYCFMVGIPMVSFFVCFLCYLLGTASVVKIEQDDLAYANGLLKPGIYVEFPWSSSISKLNINNVTSFVMENVRYDQLCYDIIVSLFDVTHVDRIFNQTWSRWSTDRTMIIYAYLSELLHNPLNTTIVNMKLDHLGVALNSFTFTQAYPCCNVTDVTDVYDDDW